MPASLDHESHERIAKGAKRFRGFRAPFATFVIQISSRPVCRLLSAVHWLGQFAIHPLQVVVAAMHHGDSQDLRHLVGVGLPDRLLEFLVQVLPALHDAQPFLGRLDLTLPPVGAGDGADDLRAGGYALFDNSCGDCLGGWFGGGGGEGLDVGCH